MSAAVQLPELRSTLVDGRRMSWRESGEGIPLVLVHGIGGYSASWRRQFSWFSRWHRVVAWDAPGYGHSDPLPESALSSGAYGETLGHLLHTLGIERPHLVGHSLGAIIILEAARRGVQSRSLTLLQPVTGSGRLPLEEREKVRAARIADMKKLGPVEFGVQRGRQILSRTVSVTAADEAIAVMKAVPENGYLAAWEMMCAADIFSLLDQACPVQVICGSEDPVSPPSMGEAIAARVPNAKYTCLSGTGHYASIEAPDALNALLNEFIRPIQH